MDEGRGRVDEGRGWVDEGPCGEESNTKKGESELEVWGVDCIVINATMTYHTVPYHTTVWGVNCIVINGTIVLFAAIPSCCNMV